MEILSIPSLYKVDQASRTPGEKKTREDAGNDCEALINLFPTKRQIKPQLCIYVFIWCLKICS